MSINTEPERSQLPVLTDDKDVVQLLDTIQFRQQLVDNCVMDCRVASLRKTDQSKSVPPPQ